MVYVFYKGLDMKDFDMTRVGDKSVDEMVKICESMPDCVGFNTLGYFKKYIDLNRLHKSPYLFRDTDGIYINSDRLKVLLNSEQASYSMFRKELDTLTLPVNYSTNRIPNIYHFIYLNGGYDFLMCHYIAIKATYSVQKPDAIYLYNDIEPVNNVWWDRVKKIATVVKIQAPSYINNHYIKWMQHRADVMRINILNKFGGVYMDLDIISLKSLDDLRDNTIVMARERDIGLCNCVIMAKPNTKMLTKWIEQYEQLYGTLDSWWTGLSVSKPAEIAKQFPEEITIIDQHKFLPFLYNDFSLFKCYREDGEEFYKDSYTMHLWDTELTKYHDILPSDIDYFTKQKNTFTHMFRKYVEEFC